MIRIRISGWSVGPAPLALPQRARDALAWALRRASSALEQIAQRLASPPLVAERPARQQIEFHAEAGAPEGALYVDGKLVGWLDGVSRL